ncbi:A designed selected ankyrin repeat protein in complex with the Map kinase Erk2 [Lactarius deliciosus]|nr:A designed selected ankyrin repeat protein in complex with the Map kinase Erk2 [Lactarius deliciosus]
MGNTPLHHAAFYGHIEFVRILLERNVETNARDEEGSTPLHHATYPEGFRAGWWGGSPDVVRLLLDHGADACLRDNDGNTALHWAAYGGHLEVCRILLERNVEANSLNDEGSAPLHQASEGLKVGSADIVRLLLDHGADVHVRNLSGKTPSEVARGPEQQKIVELLSQHTVE